MPIDNSAESAVSRCKEIQCPFQGIFIKIRPRFGEKNEFGIRALPEKEIGQPLFAGSPDDQIGVGHIGQIEVFGDGLFRNLVGRACSCLHLGGDLAGCMNEFFPAAVGQAQDELGSIELGSFLFDALKQTIYGIGQIGATAHDPQADFIVAQRFPVCRKEAGQKGHQAVYFGSGALPVFDAEGIQGNPLDSEFGGPFQESPDGIRAGMMTADAGQPS